jgi:Zn finger protein HypA/HybF involved in hydrogenase expression
MVAMLKRRTECTCVKCGHEWVSNVKSPQQCPGCKRKDWTGLHNSMGRLLVAAAAVECKCGKCEYVWSPRKPDPKQCPMCKRYDWAGNAAPVAAAPEMRGGRITRQCPWCNNVFIDDVKGPRPGFCGRCGTNVNTGEDMIGDRWSKERLSEVFGRVDARGRVIVKNEHDTFDPLGTLWLAKMGIK